MVWAALRPETVSSSANACFLDALAILTAGANNNDSLRHDYCYARWVRDRVKKMEESAVVRRNSEAFGTSC